MDGLLRRLVPSLFYGFIMESNYKMIRENGILTNYYILIGRMASK